MKRVLGVLIAVVMCGILFAACGKDGAESVPGKEPPTADVVTAVSEKLTFKDEMMTVDAKMIPNFYRIDMDKVEEVTMYASSSGGTAEEVTVFKMKDAADAQLAKDAISERIEDQKIGFENYVPEEMVKINAAITLENGKYVMLVMADDTSSVEETFNAQF